jgi:hypothetical protein
MICSFKDFDQKALCVIYIPTHKHIKKRKEKKRKEKKRKEKKRKEKKRKEKKRKEKIARCSASLIIFLFQPTR